MSGKTPHHMVGRVVAFSSSASQALCVSDARHPITNRRAFRGNLDGAIFSRSHLHLGYLGHSLIIYFAKMVPPIRNGADTIAPAPLSTRAPVPATGLGSPVF